MKDVTAVILGGGRGTRLAPLTKLRAKPAVGFAGKYRLIDIPLSNCINSNIKRVFVLTQFLSASLHRHIMQTYQFDTFSDGFIDILAAEQTPQRSDWFQGTADAVRATLEHVTYFRSNQTLILSGDHLYRMNYKDLVRRHKESGAHITICVHPVSRAEAPQMGLLRVDARGAVTSFVEKTADPDILDQYRAPPSMTTGGEDQYLASMGVYVFETPTLVKLLAGTSPKDFGKEIIPSSIDTHRVMAYAFDDYWRDIGTIESYFDANIALAQPDPPFRLYQPRWPFYTRTRSLPPSRIIHSNIKDSLLVEGSDITGAEITDSILGVRSVVREGTSLSEVVMLGADYYDGEEIYSEQNPESAGVPPLGIGRNCQLERVIIDKNVRIGDGVTIRAHHGVQDEQGPLVWVRDGITIVPKGTVIPEGTTL